MSKVIESENIDPRVTYIKNLIAAKGYKNVGQFSKINNIPSTTMHDLIAKSNFGKIRVDTLIQICIALEISPAFISSGSETGTGILNGHQAKPLIELQEALAVREQRIIDREKALITRELELNQREREVLLKESQLLSNRIY